MSMHKRQRVSGQRACEFTCDLHIPDRTVIRYDTALLPCASMGRREGRQSESGVEEVACATGRVVREKVSDNEGVSRASR